MIILGSFLGCEEKDDTYSLTGSWVNEQKDTLLFVNNSIVEYKSHITDVELLSYFYEISKDSITLWLCYSSNTHDIKKYYFECSNNQIEIRNFQNIELDFYKRLK
jgi:hypothetical protein